MNPTILPSLIERFFTQRLMQQRNVSPNTIASYRGYVSTSSSFRVEETRPTAVAIEPYGP
jgi:hypothetical protein